MTGLGRGGLLRGRRGPAAIPTCAALGAAPLPAGSGNRWVHRAAGVVRDRRQRDTTAWVASGLIQCGIDPQGPAWTTGAGQDAARLPRLAAGAPTVTSAGPPNSPAAPSRPLGRDAAAGRGRLLERGGGPGRRGRARLCVRPEAVADGTQSADHPGDRLRRREATRSACAGSPSPPAPTSAQALAAAQDGIGSGRLRAVRFATGDGGVLQRRLPRTASPPGQWVPLACPESTGSPRRWRGHRPDRFRRPRLPAAHRVGRRRRVAASGERAGTAAGTAGQARSRGPGSRSTRRGDLEPRRHPRGGLRCPRGLRGRRLPGPALAAVPRGREQDRLHSGGAGAYAVASGSRQGVARPRAECGAARSTAERRGGRSWASSRPAAARTAPSASPARSDSSSGESSGLLAIATTVALAAVVAVGPAGGARPSASGSRARPAPAPLFNGGVASPSPTRSTAATAVEPIPAPARPARPRRPPRPGRSTTRCAAAGIPWRGNWDASFRDFFIDSIGPYASAGPDRYWSLTINGRFASGGCLARVVDGDSVRFLLRAAVRPGPADRAGLAAGEPGEPGGGGGGAAPGSQPGRRNHAVDVEIPCTSAHPLLNPGSTKLISSPSPGPFSVSHKLPVIGSKLMPKTISHAISIVQI